jgi:hypothetical protein
MSTGTPSDPVCDNQTAALIAVPQGVRSATAPVDPVCRAFATSGDQTAVPDAPPAGR